MHRGENKHRNVVGALRSFQIISVFLVIWEAKRVRCGRSGKRLEAIK